MKNYFKTISFFIISPILSVFLFSGLVYAEGELISQSKNEPTLMDKVGNHFRTILCKGEWALLVPINTWHNRAMYDKEKTDGYNERPWGIGGGKQYTDSNGNRHTLFLMEFQDSHNDVEPFAGYAYQWVWGLDEANDWRVSLGGVLGITMRSDFHYIPFPAPLPILGFEYKQLAIESTYIPGGHNSGNILFTWLRWSF